MLVHDILDGRSTIAPSAPAVTDLGAGTTFSYREMVRRSEQTALVMLRGSGLKTGDRVALLAGNRVEYIDLLVALSRIGCILVPLNWRLTGDELGHVLGDAAPNILLFGNDHADLARDIARAGRIPALPLDELPAARRTVASMQLPPIVDDESRPLLILYTSGTTGRAKGAVIPQRQVVWNCINTAVCWELRPTDVTPIFTPMFHAGGLFAFLMPMLYAGGHVIIVPGFEPDESLRIIQRHHCSVVLGVPTLFQLWRQSPEYRTLDCSHVRWFISGGAPCPPALMDAWRREQKVIVRQGYGLTEAGVNCFTMTDGESERKAGSVGKPMLHSRMRLLDEKGSEVETGHPGELQIFGPHVCSGYWNNAAATSRVLHDGWFATGDIARRDDEGFYYIIGRLKDMIISGGENISSAEVEGVFREHPSVLDAALVGQPDERWGEIGILFVVPRPECRIDQGDLLDFAGERLARYKLPKRVILINGLPYSPYGKVEKAKLRDHLLSPGGSS